MSPTPTAPRAFPETHTRATSRGTVVLTLACPADPQDAHDGAMLVQQVSQETGFPDPAAWPGNTLRDRTLQRQAVAIVVGTVRVDTGRMVAHGLLTDVKPYWATIEMAREDYAAGRLAECGALATALDFRGLGLASWLRTERVRIAVERGLRPVAVTWEDGRSDPMYAGRPDWLLAGQRQAEITGAMTRLWMYRQP